MVPKLKSSGWRHKYVEIVEEKTIKWTFLSRFFSLKEWGSENVSLKLYLEISKIDKFTVV
jgi:hypothetical protein